MLNGLAGGYNKNEKPINIYQLIYKNELDLWLFNFWREIF